MSGILTLILAAGKGTRMKSDLTKVLHQVGGKPMVEHVIDSVSTLNSDIVCIVGHQEKKVKEQLVGKDIKFAVQENQLGTGHAVIQAREYIKQHKGPVLVLYGDTPLLTTETLEKLISYHRGKEAGLSILTACLDDPSGYGRIIKGDQGQVKKIREEDDASPSEKKIKEINSGVYCFDGEMLNRALDSLDCDNEQGEYYLTDTVNYINEIGKKVVSVTVKDNNEIIGVNDRKNLAVAEDILRQRINDEHMENGVTIIDPDTTYIDREVEIENDTVIYPFTYLEGQTKVGKGTVVGPHSRLVDAQIGSQVNLKSNCNIWDSRIGNNCEIGPFAYIRPGCEISDNVKIGDYVELKKAIIKDKTKVPHLSYVGDAEIGEGTNVGAGTIFANYDGKNKHKTVIGNSVFIGSNTTLVAPVCVENKGKTGAGSVVTRDVAENTTVVGVPARIFKKDKDKGEN